MAITEFSGEHRWLSNFWPATVTYHGFTFPSIENAYQAAKCLHVEDMEQFTTCTAKEAKALGRKVTMHPDFDKVKIEVMRELVRQKFAPNTELAYKLLQTGSQDLIEGNWWNDTFWGICRGVGENWLGRLLMERRAELDTTPPVRDLDVVIFGSRDFTDLETMCKVIEGTKLFTSGRIRSIISGTARGADQTGELFAKKHHFGLIRMPADWDTYGKSAGYRRNEDMAKAAHVAIGFWDGESRGTKHMIDICRKQGIPLIVYNTSDGTTKLYRKGD